MSALPAETPSFDVETLDQVRLRLVDAAGDLRPLPSMAEMTGRVRAVAAELHAIEEELLLILHVQQLMERGFVEKLRNIDKRLADGWKPESEPAEDFVARLQDVEPNPHNA